MRTRSWLVAPRARASASRRQSWPACPSLHMTIAPAAPYGVTATPARWEGSKRSVRTEKLTTVVVTTKTASAALVIVRARARRARRACTRSITPDGSAGRATRSSSRVNRSSKLGRVVHLLLFAVAQELGQRSTRSEQLGLDGPVAHAEHPRDLVHVQPEVVAEHCHLPLAT